MCAPLIPLDSYKAFAKILNEQLRSGLNDDWLGLFRIKTARNAEALRTASTCSTRIDARPRTSKRFPPAPIEFRLDLTREEHTTKRKARKTQR